MDIYFKEKTKILYKETFKFLNFIIIALGFIIAIILIKYKPIYKVSISGKEVGYIQSKEAFEESIKEDITNSTDKNIDYFDIKITPEYELKLVNKELKTNEQEISKLLEENVDITYKYYEIALNNNTIECVNTIEEAEELVNKVKEENKEELDLSIVEKYTNEEQEVKTTGIEIAETAIQEKINTQLEEEKRKRTRRVV